MRYEIRSGFKESVANKELLVYITVLYDDVVGLWTRLEVLMRLL